MLQIGKDDDRSAFSGVVQVITSGIDTGFAKSRMSTAPMLPAAKGSAHRSENVPIPDHPLILAIREHAVKRLAEEPTNTLCGAGPR